MIRQDSLKCGVLPSELVREQLDAEGNTGRMRGVWARSGDPMWSMLLSACPRELPPPAAPAPPAPVAAPADRAEDALRESQRLLEGYAFPPEHRPWVLRAGGAFVETLPCTGSGGEWLPGLLPPVLPEGGYAPDWARVGWRGAAPDAATPFVVTCVRRVDDGCGSGGTRAIAGPEGQWFAERTDAEQRAARLPDCPAP